MSHELRSEPELRTAIAKTLRALGLVVEEGVACEIGCADLVIGQCDTIYEVKHRLTRSAIYTGIGQVLLYRQSLNRQAQVVIAGYEAPETKTLRPYVEALGIEVVIWSDST